MSYKDDNRRRLRSLDEQWRREAEERRFDADVHRVKYRQAVRNAARADAVPRGTKNETSVAMHVLHALCFVAKIIVMGTLAVLCGIVVAIVGASKHK